MMARMPVAGVVWQTVHYLVGFQRLGYEVYYVEAHATTPTMFLDDSDHDGSDKVAAFLDGVLRRFDLGDRWAFHALHADGRSYGLSAGQLARLYDSTRWIINLHGGTLPLPEHCATNRLIFLETDPVQVQIELSEDNPQTIEFLDSHCAFFTFGENYGRPDCLLPVSDRYDFRPTRQPVVLDFWREGPRPPARCSRPSATGGSGSASWSSGASAIPGASTTSSSSSSISPPAWSRVSSWR